MKTVHGYVSESEEEQENQMIAEKASSILRQLDGLTLNQIELVNMSVKRFLNEKAKISL